MVFETAMAGDTKHSEHDGPSFHNILNMSALTDHGQLLIGQPTPPMTNKASKSQSRVDLGDQITCGEICVPLKEIFFITDLLIISKDFAVKLKQNNLEGTFIMVRGYHEPEYWTQNKTEHS